MSETGQNWLIYVDDSATPSYDAPNWKLVGGQRGLEFGRSLGTADATTKDSNHNEETLPTTKSRELSLDNLYQSDDEGLAVLEKMHENLEKRPVKIDNGTLQFKFWAWCTEFPLSAPMDDAVSQAITLKPTGAVERIPALT